MKELEKMYKIVVSKDAAKYYKKSDSKTKHLLNRCFDELATEPYRNQNSKKLHGKLAGLLRYRIGNLRVVYRVNNEEIIVVIIAIGSRGDVYNS